MTDKGEANMHVLKITGDQMIDLIRGDCVVMELGHMKDNSYALISYGMTNEEVEAWVEGKAGEGKVVVPGRKMDG